MIYYSSSFKKSSFFRQGGNLDNLADLFGDEKANKIRRFFRTGRGRRQDHGTRGNANRRLHEDPWTQSHERDAERALERQIVRHGGLICDEDIIEAE